jgi:hypothetical protein
MVGDDGGHLIDSTAVPDQHRSRTPTDDLGSRQPPAISASTRSLTHTSPNDLRVRSWRRLNEKRPPAGGRCELAVVEAGDHFRGARRPIHWRTTAYRSTVTVADPEPEPRPSTVSALVTNPRFSRAR